MVSKGLLFVQNYFRGEAYKSDKSQNIWAILPDEDNMSRVYILYQIPKDCRNTNFVGFQLIFEINFHEDHPYRGVAIRTHTPNSRTISNEYLCINGLTSYHPESWNIITSMSSLIERFMCAFLDTDNVKNGIGFEKRSFSEEEIISFKEKSKEWNLEHFPLLSSVFEEQMSKNNLDLIDDDNLMSQEETEEEFEYDFDNDL